LKFKGKESKEENIKIVSGSF